MTDNDRKLREVIDQIEDLPTLPSVVTRLLAMVEKPDTTAEDINALISQDPSLTAKVLKLVNSAFYGFSRRISTVTEAVVILGFDTVKSLVLSASVFEVFKGEGSENFDRVGLWEHSIATGVAGEIVGKKLRVPNPEEIMVGGILHDIGKIVIDIHFREKLPEIFAYVQDHNCLMLEAEREILGVGHPEIGGWLSETWNLPEDITCGIKFYPRPMEAPQDHRFLPLLIHIGDILARTQNLGWTGDQKIPPFQEEAWDQIDLAKDDLESIMDELDDAFEDAEAFLELSRESEGGTQS